MATAMAFLGQILGASRIPADLRAKIGDDLVMGIQYRRPEMTLTALARDTARMGVLMSRDCNTGVELVKAPHLAPLPADNVKRPAVRVDYDGPPATAPGQAVRISVSTEDGRKLAGAVSVTAPTGWTAPTHPVPPNAATGRADIEIRPRADLDPWPHVHRFSVRQGATDVPLEFGIAGAALWQVLGVYWDIQPAEPLDNVIFARPWQHHFASLSRPYLPEPVADAPALFQRFSRVLGRPAVAPALTHRVDLSGLIGLRGAYCVYLARTVVSPDARDVYLVIGNNGPYRVWLNGVQVAERDEHTWWTPHNAAWKVRLQAGDNPFVVKLVKQDERLDFSLGLRCDTGFYGGFGGEDWCTDLADRNMLLLSGTP